jgi:hypothetical protein
MSNFDYVQKSYDISQAMFWLDMPELGEEAQLLLRPATNANPGYYNALLRMNGKRARKLATSISTADIEKIRSDDRILFPKYVIADWRKVETAEDRRRLPEEREYVPFNEDNVAELCQKASCSPVRSCPQRCADRRELLPRRPDRS